MNAFQAALAKKSAAIQAEREKVEVRKQFARDWGNAASQPTPATVAGAQATALLTAFDSMPVPTPEPVLPDPIHIPEIRIERVLDRGRLDVYFSDKPGDHVLGALKACGFRFRPSDKAWFHADTEKNRFILTDLLGVDFCEESAREVLAHDSTAGVPNEKSDDVDYSKDSPEFARFRQQTDELIQELGISAADLMLQAIDCLHKTTFGRN